MSWWPWLLTAAIIVATSVIFVGGLVVAGRHEDARALARFIPDCVIFFRRILGDHRVPRRNKLLVLALVAYLVMPIDLVPDFIPIAGQLDDAIAVAIVLRILFRATGNELLEEHWPGPRASLDVLTRVAVRGHA